MRTATIDYGFEEFNVTVLADGKRVDANRGTYPEVIRFAVQAGVARGRITLTKTAQEAAAEACFGGAA